MQVALRKLGNSQAVIIPKAVLLQLGLTNHIEMAVKDNKIILSAPKKNRQGWALAACALSESGDDQLLDFPADNEEEWVW